MVGVTGFRVPPLALTGLTAAAQLVLARRSRPTRGSLVVGGAIGLGSAGLLLSSVASFRHHDTTVNPIEVEKSSSLVRSGVFAITRNPMYVGMAGLLVAHAVARRSALAAVPAMLFVGAMDRGQIPAEEHALRAHFGDDFDAYRRDVPRWLGIRSLRS